MFKACGYLLYYSSAGSLQKIFESFVIEPLASVINFIPCGLYHQFHELLSETAEYSVMPYCTAI